MIIAALLVFRRAEVIEALIKRELEGKKIVFVGNIEKCANIKEYVEHLQKCGTDVVFFHLTDQNVSFTSFGDIFFDAVLYDNRTSETPNTKNLAKRLHSKSVVISNGDDSVIPDFIEGMKSCIITYGLGSKCSLTPSSIDDSEGLCFNLSVQRQFVTLCGGSVAIGEFKVEFEDEHINIYDALAIWAFKLLLEPG